MIISSWATGLFFIFIVTIIWTAASYLTEYIYSDLEFKSPFLLTYFSSSFFVLYLPLWQLWVSLKWVQDPPSCRVSTDNLTKNNADCMVYNILDQNSNDGENQSNVNVKYSKIYLNEVYIKSGNKIARVIEFIKEAFSLVKIPKIPSKVSLLRRATAEPSEIHPNTQLELSSKDQDPHSILAADFIDSDNPEKTSIIGSKYTHTEILSIAIILCPLWFIANCSYNYALLYTSVGSSTIISNLSGAFTLFFSWLYGVEKVSIGKILGLLICFMGVAMVAVADTDSANEKASYRSLLGDIMAVLGAAGYGMYTTMLRLKVSEDGSASMQLLLGYLGLVSIVILSPMLILMASLDLGDVRQLTWTAFGFVLLSGFFDNVIADYLWYDKFC